MKEYKISERLFGKDYFKKVYISDINEIISEIYKRVNEKKGYKYNGRNVFEPDFLPLIPKYLGINVFYMDSLLNPKEGISLQELTKTMFGEDFFKIYKKLDQIDSCDLLNLITKYKKTRKKEYKGLKKKSDKIEKNNEIINDFIIMYVDLIC